MLRSASSWQAMFSGCEEVFRFTGEVLEWLKRHAWKACNRQNRFAGSNPVLSAMIRESLWFPFLFSVCHYLSLAGWFFFVDELTKRQTHIGIVAMFPMAWCDKGKSATHLTQSLISLDKDRHDARLCFFWCKVTNNESNSQDLQSIIPKICNTFTQIRPVCDMLSANRRTFCFLRQQRQQWQREERAQRFMSRGDIQLGQQVLASFLLS